MGGAAVGIREVGSMAGPNSDSGNSPRATEADGAVVTGISDGPASPLFAPLPLQGNSALADLEQAGLSQHVRENILHAPSGNCVCWGIPFRVERIALVKEISLELKWPEVEAPWLVLMHTTDMSSEQANPNGFVPATRGPALLRERVADHFTKQHRIVDDEHSHKQSLNVGESKWCREYVHPSRQPGSLDRLPTRVRYLQRPPVRPITN